MSVAIELLDVIHDKSIEYNLSLHVPHGRPGLNTVERSLIRHALAEGHDILNIMGTKERLHHIHSAGSRETRDWLPRHLAVPKRQPTEQAIRWLFV